MSDSPSGFTGLGKLVSVVLVLALLGVGGYVTMKKMNPAVAPAAKGTGSPVPSPAEPSASNDHPSGGLESLAVAQAQSSVPTLAPPAAYVSKDNVVDLELSEYAGYAGLIAANGGLDPSEDSYFARRHGFKVRIKLSEEESWSALNSGRMAASATTVDVLAVYGKQFQVVTPAQIGFSRGADGIVVKREIKRINGLKGQVVIATQFTESEFFLRFLAQEAGIEVAILDDLKRKPNPDRINLVFAEDGFQAGDIFAKELADGTGRLAACVTWEPKTSEVVRSSGGRAGVLASNRNLLVIADVLIVNKGFAAANPKIVAGLVDGLLYGNKQVRDNPDAQRAVVAKAFKWSPAKVAEELAKVHLSNLPENQAFFSGAIDMAGSFGGIYQAAVYSYGKEFIKDAPPAERFLDLSAVNSLAAAGTYKEEKLEIQPIRTSAAGSIETDPLLSKDIRFLFLPNDPKLDLSQPSNLERLESIKALLKVSPGSTVLLRGHVDDARKDEIKKQGEQVLRNMAMKAVQLSKDRAAEVRRLLIEKYQVDPARIETVGLGWDEPVGRESEQNRRVEVQWFTIE